jgi:hypothetical protein
MLDPRDIKAYSAAAAAERGRYVAWRFVSGFSRTRNRIDFQVKRMPFNSPELVQASQEGDLATVRRLLDSGADVNSTDEHGMGPLLTFTPSVVDYLLSKGPTQTVRRTNPAPLCLSASPT